MDKKLGSMWLWLLLGLLIVFVFQAIFLGKSGKSNAETVVLQDYNEFLRMLDEKKFVSVQVTPNPDGMLDVVATDKGEKKYSIIALNNPKLIDKLTANPAVKFIPRRPSNNWFVAILGWVLPVLLFFMLWSFFMRRSMGGGMGGGSIMNFGQSRAKLFHQNGAKVTFADVAGVDEAKEELREIIEFLKDPRKFTKLGGRMPKGCLLIGPPGTGKTLLARAVAGEANVPFFSIAGSNFVEMFVGVGASRVRDLFQQAQEHAPCIIFIDELDAIGGKRGLSVMSGGTNEQGQTLNQLLVEMDGFEINEGVVLLSATNRPEVLDPALLRPGRFDRQIVVNRPDIKGREEILKVHVGKVPLADDVNLSVIARGTPGYVGADLANLINEAALAAARAGRNKVAMEDLEEAKDKVFMGKARKSAVISEKTKRIVAYHETGHTLVAKSIPAADPVHKVTIIPRGMALGLTGSLPEEDMLMHSKSYLLAQLAILMGGRAAEEIFCGDISTGASNDIQKATELARKMVCEWGMSEKLGPQKIGSSTESAFLGDQAMGLEGKNYSEKTSAAIDEEVKKLINDAYEKAKSILGAKQDIARRIAEALLEKETLDGAELDKIIKG